MAVECDLHSGTVLLSETIFGKAANVFNYNRITTQHGIKCETTLDHTIGHGLGADIGFWS